MSANLRNRLKRHIWHRTRGLFRVVMIVAILGLVSPAFVGPAAASAQFSGQIESGWNVGTCLDVKWGQHYNGNQVWLYQCNGTSAQSWSFEQQQNVHTYVIKDATGQYCLDAPFASGWGRSLQIWQCNYGSNQMWHLEPSSGKFAWTNMYRNVYSGLCLDDYAWRGPANGQGALLVTWGCNYYENQSWSVP